MLIPVPQQVQDLLDSLEAAGFQAWAVGGCVRDSLLGLPPHDWDLCTDARPDQVESVFQTRRLIRAGARHGTIAVGTDLGPVEITTFRTEGDYQDHRRPGWVHFERDVEADLGRRDFTVNAMAYSPLRGLKDPCGGRADLAQRVLRAVGQPRARFQEDGLRILRGVRFAARFGLTPEPETLAAMADLAPLLRDQARERVFAELCGLLPWARAQDLITFAPVLVQALPVLAPCLGFVQHNPHHAYDVYGHTARTVEAVPRTMALRWAALLHDVGKPDCFTLDRGGVGHFYGHARRSAELARQCLEGLRAPKALTAQVCTLVEYHGVCWRWEEKTVRRLLLRLGEPTLRELLDLDRADDQSKGTPAHPAVFGQFAKTLDRVLAERPCLSQKDLAVGGRELLALGFSPGPALGRALATLLELVGDGSLPNEPQALLERARALLEQNTSQ